MLTENLKSTFFRKSNLLFLLALIYFLLISGLPVEAQKPKDLVANKKLQKAFAATLKKNPWANIKGFRSAKFGMDEEKVLKAITKDFKVNKDKVARVSSVTEGTTVLEVKVPKLFTTGGTAKLGYIFGAKSKKLVHVNIIWGQVVAGDVDVQSIIYTANLLNTHFAKKRYKVEGLISNGRLSDTSAMVFRGKDKKGRMVLLMLNTPSPNSDLTIEQKSKQVSLVLSYIANPDKPDVRAITMKNDEF